MIAKDYDEKCDCWSIGVITYMLLSGMAPFSGSSNAEIMQRVKQGQYSFSGLTWAEISDEAKDFIRTMLTVDRHKRPSSREALDHPWLKTTERKSMLQTAVLSDVVSNLVDFKNFSTLKRLALEMVAFSLDPEQIKSLRAEFTKFDSAEDGEISVKEFRDGLKRSSQIHDADVDRIFASIDIDHSGVSHECCAAV